MYFYEVWVRSNRYHGSQALTYQSSEALSVGQLVQVPLQRETVTAFVTAQVAKPSFACKPLQAVMDLPPLPAALVQLGRWLQAYYPAPLGLVAQQLTPAITKIAPDQAVPLPKPDTKKLPPLTTEQQQALDRITHPDTYLLHGKTGSGKTRLYISLVAKLMAKGRSSLILTPEISLTSQLVDRFTSVFGNRVVLMHSQLTPVERRTAWQRLLTSTEPLVVIGPRSILFSPLKNIGLIVLDESHEPAYKQEQAPHYQASRVAAKLRELHDATLVLGSATPSISDYYEAEQRGKPVVIMSQLAISSEQPVKITIIDLKDHGLFPRSNYLSQPLVHAVEQALASGEQTLLYLNRRGTARVIICENCGWQALCPHCDIPLTYHGDAHELRCHVCNTIQSPPTVCPDCGQPSIVYKTIGTKAVVDEVRRLFPQARVQRFDTDNTKAERFEQHYEAVRRGDVDILVGTQLLAKGLDLPNLSVLGVLMADTSLQIPDYTAGERTYQLLTQVLGRIGRGHRGGQAFVQTYQPDNPVVQNAVLADWPDFYKRELAERRVFKFPPFYYVLKLSVRRASAAAAAKAAQTFADSLDGSSALIIEGPAPSLHEKIAGKYQYQLVIKATRRAELLAVIAKLPANWSYDIDPADLL
jgi:primosomal protein N' (replication factor Y) (superfamily II helicase)